MLFFVPDFECPM